MLVAVVATLFDFQIVEYRRLGVAIVAGVALGIPLGLLVPMTAVPQEPRCPMRSAPLAAGPVGTAEYYLHRPAIDGTTMVAIGFEVVLGFLTLTGRGRRRQAPGPIRDRPWVYRGQNIVNVSILCSASGHGRDLVARPDAAFLFPIAVASRSCSARCCNRSAERTCRP